MSAAQIDRHDSMNGPEAAPDERPSGIRRVSSVSVAARQGRASSLDIGEAPVANGVRGLRSVFGFWAVVVLGLVAWFVTR